MLCRRKRVILLAAAFRTVTVGLALLFDHVFSDYDTSTSLSSRKECDVTLQAEDDSVLSNLVVWDTVFFVRIAQCGYEYEQYHAFFPLLPSQLHHHQSTKSFCDTSRNHAMDRCPFRLSNFSRRHSCEVVV